MLLGAPATGPDSAALVLISGTAGVGKTALAVRWAHRAADRFPDGQVYANLHGYARAVPVRPIEALSRFLRALGVPAERVPDDVDEAAALYRSVLADRRVLVVLDNVATPDQVRPLLPGGPGSGVLVTSRDRLSGLVALDGARRVGLDVLAPDEAAELIARVVGDDRVAAAPQAVAELAELCGYLPLALRVAATTLLDRPDGTIAELVTTLRTTDRLSMLAVEGDEDAAVRAAFDLSYATLPAPARRLFRLLGSCPAEDFTGATAAALAGVEVRATAPLLDRLAGAHLVERPHPGRFAFHDLIRLYAAERCRAEDPPDARAAADARLLAWYVRTSRAAAAQFNPFLLRLPTTSAPAGGPSLAFDSSGAAGAWLDDERHNLVAVARYAGGAGLVAAAELSDALRGYFRQRRHSLDWLAVAQAGVAAATSVGDPVTAAAARISLADANSCAGDVDEAAVHFGAAADLSRTAGWSRGEAVALAGRGGTRESAGRSDEAVDLYAGALAINRSIGWVRGQAQNVSAMGLAYLSLGRPGRAATCLTEAVDLSRQVDDRSSEAYALNRLGLAYHAMGRLAAAVTCFEEALAIARATGDHVAEAATLDSRAAVRRDLGEYEAALADAHAAVGLTEETAQHSSFAFVRNTLATIELCVGDAARARDLHAEAADLARRGGSRPGECEAQIGLSAAHRALGRYDEAAAHAELALGLAGDPVSRAAALTVRGDACLPVGRISAAADAALLAVAAARESGQRLGEARALVLLGRARATQGQNDQAVLHWRAACEIFSEAGAEPERTRVADLLARTARLARR
jgi:tetratricopeptide (TPR) repeat protein